MISLADLQVKDALKMMNDNDCRVKLRGSRMTVLSTSWQLHKITVELQDEIFITAYATRWAKSLKPIKPPEKLIAPGVDISTCTSVDYQERKKGSQQQILLWDVNE